MCIARQGAARIFRKYGCIASSNPPPPTHHPRLSGTAMVRAPGRQTAGRHDGSRKGSCWARPRADPQLQSPCANLCARVPRRDQADSSGSRRAEQRLAIERGELDGDWRLLQQPPGRLDGSATAWQHPFVRFNHRAAGRRKSPKAACYSSEPSAQTEEHKDPFDGAELSPTSRPARSSISEAGPRSASHHPSRPSNETMQDKDFLSAV